MDILPCCRCSVAVGGPLWSPASYTDGLPTLDSLVILVAVILLLHYILDDNSMKIGFYGRLGGVGVTDISLSGEIIIRMKTS